MISHYKC